MRKILLVFALCLFGIGGVALGQHLGDPTPLKQDTIHSGVDTVFVRPPVVVRDTVYLLDLSYINGTRNWDYYDYYCAGDFCQSFDCNGYLYRTGVWYIPRYRPLPFDRDRRPYAAPPRFPIPNRPFQFPPAPRGYPQVMPDRSRPVPPIRPAPPGNFRPAPPPPRPVAPPPRPSAPPIHPSPPPVKRP